MLIFNKKTDFFMNSQFIRLVVLSICLFLSVPFVTAYEKPLQSVLLPESVNQGLTYMLSLAYPENIKKLDLTVFEKVIGFVLTKKDKNILYYSDMQSEASSAFHEYEVNRNLKHFLDHKFNPNIPHFILSPSSLRLSYWKEVNGKKQTQPDFSSMFASLKDHAVVTGIEHEEITPDINSGAYYGYDLLRTFILMKYQGRPALISITKQKNISAVGKKGVILGKDDNWDYFYSGQNGTTLPGLGWINSYMYDSYSVSVFIEMGSGTSTLVRCGIFKWLRAGWADINMVQSKHIYQGLHRYSDTVKKILEHSSLPAPDKMAEVFSGIKAFSEEELRIKIRNYTEKLYKKYINENSNGIALIAEALKDSSYFNQMDIYQMQSALAVEYMKTLMGKN